MFIQEFSAVVVTDADGDATAYLGPATPDGGVGPINGYLSQLLYRKPGSGGYSDGVDFTITTERTARNLWVQVNVNASADVAPRVPTHDTAGVASLHAAGGEPVEDRIALANERIKIVVGSGGDTLTGTFYALIG